MIGRDDARRVFRAALYRFASPWDIVEDLTEVTIHDPNHWLSGVGTFGATLRDPATMAVKVLGRRWGAEDGAMYHRGVSGLVLQAYLDGTPDPLRRYLEEIGVVSSTSPRDTGIAGVASVPRATRAPRKLGALLGKLRREPPRSDRG